MFFSRPPSAHTRVNVTDNSHAGLFVSAHVETGCQNVTNCSESPRRPKPDDGGDGRDDHIIREKPSTKVTELYTRCICVTYITTHGTVCSHHILYYYVLPTLLFSIHFSRFYLKRLDITTLTCYIMRFYRQLLTGRDVVVNGARETREPNVMMT